MIIAAHSAHGPLCAPSYRPVCPVLHAYYYNCAYIQGLTIKPFQKYAFWVLRTIYSVHMQSRSKEHRVISLRIYSTVVVQ